jgi:uncharacterized protein YbjT (DUF2867 family)
MGYDFNHMLSLNDWLPLLQNIDVVINCVGIIVETRTQTFARLHVEAPKALFLACKHKSIKRIIQISALGADERAITPYQLSKRAADDSLRQLNANAFILRPSLVYGKNGKSSRLFQYLAMLPIIPLIAQGQQRIQPVHLNDLVATVLCCVETTQAPFTLDVAGSHSISFVEFLQILRQHQGKKPAPSLSISFGLAIVLSRLMKYIVPLFHPNNLRMLQRNNIADIQPLTSFLGRKPIEPENFHQEDKI